MSQLTDKVEAAIESVITSLGLELEYTELVKEGGNNVYRIVLDKACGKVSIDDCENVSRSVEDIVDKFVNIKDGYVLEVSSAGLERKLVNLNLYKKYVGSEVKIKLFKKINDSKELQGILKQVKNDIVVISVNNDDIEINIKEIAAGNTVYDFNNI